MREESFAYCDLVGDSATAFVGKSGRAAALVGKSVRATAFGNSQLQRPSPDYATCTDDSAPATMRHPATAAALAKAP